MSSRENKNELKQMKSYDKGQLKKYLLCGNNLRDITNHSLNVAKTIKRKHH